MPTIHWFRRDLRLADNPALALAAKSATADGDVLGVFVLDPALLGPSGAPRLAVLFRTLRALDDQLGGRLVVRHGKPAVVLPKLAKEIAAESVHCAADFGPYGHRRDDEVAEALPVPLVHSGSAYAVDPGEVRKGNGTPFQVYSPFYRSWHDHGWSTPHRAPRVDWHGAESDPIPDDPRLPDGLDLPAVGEAAAKKAWKTFKDKGLRDYAGSRDRPDLDATSRMSVHLKWGTIHPRTLLADLGPADEVYRKELAWREFYADVLFHRPDSARAYYSADLKGLHYADGAELSARLSAWQHGQTGYPIVDAGMRQLLAEGWMHNRLRMIVASFLVKDLHVEWTHGARHFLAHLVDGDLASNNHGWQWVAGTGTDAAPYFRIFNPILQGKKFDPDGDYVRRWVPELNHLPSRVIHEPWSDPNGAPAGYPEPIVDHFAERDAALADYQRVKRSR
ncbi:DNA photolyase family protein [Jatrophihabitans telluris]|uniref:DNA photolyase family protein n=1 Tax=Jatrophihabitans telluris TaxID=2038343 RepID=A0ABY4R1X3_9ACTN|nr:deoxyribodipyrimidine photo-lyase [Jatrophihabitans telluris]UQX89146.1 DNA photolyase family protein [Jatrophihabitans telluris]